MLNSLIYADNDDDFTYILSLVKKLYFPQEVYCSQKYLTKLPSWDNSNPPNIDQKIRDTDKALENLVNTYCNDPHTAYPVLEKDNLKTKEHLPFPHLHLFHSFFLKRQWNQPYSDPIKDHRHLFNLHPNKHDMNLNYSKNYRNYIHFVNVIACLTRLIMYFKDWKNISRVIEAKNYEGNPPKLNNDLMLKYENIKYTIKADKRSLMVILAGFYHDIGKTMLDPRHGMEGSIILSNQTTTSIYQLGDIFREYSYSFSRDDLIFVSNLILYHDQFGTLGTGEDGYLRLVDIIDYFKTLSISKTTDRNYQFIYSQQCIFDLWVLNVADILATQKGKFVCQDGTWADHKESEAALTSFLMADPTAHNLIHDLIICFRLLKNHSHRHRTPKQHLGDTSDLKEAAYSSSKDHFVERIRRLITASLSNVLTSKSKFLRMKALEGNIHSKLREKSWDTSIVSAIQSLSDLQHFCRRFSWIGKMDYSLGFFSKIAKRALQLIEREIIDNEVILSFPSCVVDIRDHDIFDITIRHIKDKEKNDVTNDDIVEMLFLSRDSMILLFNKDLEIDTGSNPLNYEIEFKKGKGNTINFLAGNAYLAFGSNTGWIRGRYEKPFPDNFLNEINAQFFIDNYTATIIKIIHYLLFREENINNQRDLEFVDSSNGLNDNKIDKIISHVGPFQASRSIQMAMQTIYLY